MKKYLLLIIFSLCAIPLSLIAQESNAIIVTSFSINGNVQTKDETILRELDFQIGDTLYFDNLNQKLAKNQTLLMNTGLFYHVNMNVGEWDALNHVHIFINVEEAWYIYPVPIFDLADRNFNVWWKEYNLSFKRVNYGVTLYHSNLTGRRDRLKARVQLGYTQKYQIQYQIPAINKDKTIGLLTDILWTRNKEIHYNTEKSKQVFYRDDKKTLLRRYRVVLGLSYRPELYTTQQFRIGYFQENIADSIRVLNPHFFKQGKNQQRYISIQYDYIWDRRNLKDYPTQGHYLKGTVKQSGLGVFKERNSTELTLELRKYFVLHKKWSIESILKGKTRFQTTQQAFYNNKALGYGNNFLRGYEYYVIDGSSYFYTKNSLRYEFLNKTINWKKMMPLQAFKKMPLRMYFTLNTDVGYVKERHFIENNPLSNQWLSSIGLGLDIVMYVDKVVRLEYSMNHKKETDLYIHLNLFF